MLLLSHLHRRFMTYLRFLHYLFLHVRFYGRFLSGLSYAGRGNQNEPVKQSWHLTFSGSLLWEFMDIIRLTYDIFTLLP